MTNPAAPAKHPTATLRQPVAPVISIPHPITDAAASGALIKIKPFTNRMLTHAGVGHNAGKACLIITKPTVAPESGMGGAAMAAVFAELFCRRVALWGNNGRLTRVALQLELLQVKGQDGVGAYAVAHIKYKILECADIVLDRLASAGAASLLVEAAFTAGGLLVGHVDNVIVGVALNFFDESFDTV
jgi:hypothetical protein